MKKVLLEIKEKQLSLMNYLGEWWSYGEGGCIREFALVLVHTCGKSPRLKEIVDNLAH